MMHSVALFLIFLPYFGLGFLPTDVQPLFIIACIAGIFSLLLSQKTVRVPKEYFFISIMALLAIASFFYVSIRGGYVEFYDARSLFGYITPLLVIAYLYSFGVRPWKHAVTVSDIFLLFILLGYFLNYAGLTSIIQMFVSRAEVDDFFGANRGFTSFFPEQSRISTQLTLLALIYLMLGALNAIRAAAMIFLALISASGQVFVNIFVIMAAFGTSYVVFLFRSQRVQPFALVGALVLLAGFGFFIGYVSGNAHRLIDLGFPSRGVMAIHDIVELGFSYIGRDLGILYKLSGFLQGITAITLYPVSFRVGSAFYLAQDEDFYFRYLSLAQYLFSADYVPFPRRSFSIFGSWLTDFGLLGLFSFIGLFFLMFRRAFKAEGDKIMLVSLLVCFVVLFFFVFRSNSSSPTLWAVIALYFHWSSGARIERSKSSEGHSG